MGQTVNDRKSGHDDWKNVKKMQERCYYISSFKMDIKKFQEAVRGYWKIESMPCHLYVTFNEDGNHTLDKTDAQNLNIIRKMALSLYDLSN